jgi:hypothetical protein
VDRGRLSRLVQQGARQGGIAGLTFHDLRGTAVTRLALMGVEVAEIAAITGHSLKDVHAILDATICIATRSWRGTRSENWRWDMRGNQRRAARSENKGRADFPN